MLNKLPASVTKAITRHYGSWSWTLTPLREALQQEVKALESSSGANPTPMKMTAAFATTSIARQSTATSTHQRKSWPCSDFPTPLCDRNMVTFFLSTLTLLFFWETAPSENVLKGVESCLLAAILSDLRPGTRKMYGRKTSAVYLRPNSPTCVLERRKCTVGKPLVTAHPRLRCMRTTFLNPRQCQESLTEAIIFYS